MKWIDLLFKSPEQRQIDQLQEVLANGIETMTDAKNTIEYQSKVIEELALEVLRLKQIIKGMNDDESSRFQPSEEEAE
jgi:hypothetical protein